MIHFFMKRRQYELSENSTNSPLRSAFPPIFSWYSLDFVNVKQKMGGLAKPCGLEWSLNRWGVAAGFTLRSL